MNPFIQIQTVPEIDPFSFGDSQPEKSTEALERYDIIIAACNKMGEIVMNG
jgi:hypothetical protein